MSINIRLEAKNGIDCLVARRKGARGLGSLLIVLLVFLFVNSSYATSSCSASMIRCRCENGGYDLVTPEEYRKEIKNKNSCCYRNPHKKTVKSEDSFIPNPNLPEPIVKQKVNKSPDRDLEIDDGEPMRPTSFKVGFQSSHPLFLPIQIQISNLLSALYTRLPAIDD